MSRNFYARATPFFSLSSINSLFENGRVDWEERREEADGALMEFLWFAFFCLLAGRLWAARGHSAPQREDKQEEQTKWKDWRAKHTTNEWIYEWMKLCVEQLGSRIVFGWVKGGCKPQATSPKRRLAPSPKRIENGKEMKILIWISLEWTMKRGSHSGNEIKWN